MALAHELSWSVSRAGTFETCRRRYYYDYYLSWTGWEARAEEERRRCYLLKKMTRMPMLAGECLHQALARWFEHRRRGVTLKCEELVAGALAALREGYKCSRDGGWRKKPSKLVHLAEHHYGEERIDERTGAAGDYGKKYVARIEAGLEAFFGAPQLAPVREADPSRYLALEELGTIELFGTKVYAVPDFAYRDEDGVVRIWDWKSGSPREQDAFQLATYVLYAGEKWGARPGEVVCYDAYLPLGEVTERRFDEGEIAELTGNLEASMEAMRAVHFDADASAGDPEDFPMIDEDGAGGWECRTCNYRELCGR